jgi:hypothetical protein
LTNEQFQVEAQRHVYSEAIDVLRDNTIARQIFPVEQVLSVDQNLYKYYKVTEQSNTQYGHELQHPRYNRYTTTATTVAIPLHQQDLQYTRHEYKRAQKDVFNLDARKRAALEDLMDQDDQKAIGGDSVILGSTGFTNEGTNTTDMTTSLDMTTFATYTNTFETAITEAKTDLKMKDYNAGTKIIVWTPDVDARARACFSTTIDITSIYDWTAKRLAVENGVNTNGYEFIFETGYLGSATGAGTVCSALCVKHVNNYSLVVSELEVAVAIDEITGVEIEYAMRSRPVWKRAEAIHYDASTDVEA